MKALLICFVVGEASKPKRGIKETPPAQSLKSAPHYYEATVPRQFLISQDKIRVRGSEGNIVLKLYHPDFILAEATFEIENIFSEDVIQFKEEIISHCRELLKKRGAQDVEELSEEYSVFAVSEYNGDPEQFFQHKEKLVGLLKSEKLPLDPKEIEYTLSAQLKYAKNDLVVVDWDGAFIFDPEADFAPTVELLELANLNLLKYRLLDMELDKRLAYVAEIFRSIPEKRRLFLQFERRKVREALMTLIKIRASSVLDFQGVERDIRLIGDWYSARLYELAAKKFKFDEWRTEIKEKLDAIEDIYSVASERFSLSPERIELIGWFILLLGWTIILAFDLYLTFFSK